MVSSTSLSAPFTAIIINDSRISLIAWSGSCSHKTTGANSRINSYSTYLEMLFFRGISIRISKLKTFLGCREVVQGAERLFDGGFAMRR